MGAERSVEDARAHRAPVRDRSQSPIDDAAGQSRAPLLYATACARRTLARLSQWVNPRSIANILRDIIKFKFLLHEYRDATVTKSTTIFNRIFLISKIFLKNGPIIL